MRLIIAMLLGCLVAGAASAHGGPHPIGPDALWQSWNADPLVTVPLLLACWFYIRGLRRLWARAGVGRGVTRTRAIAFAAGLITLAIALLSPLDPLGETLLSAHMAQHGLLVAVAPPLLLLSRAGAVLPWALPAGWRRQTFGSAAWRALARSAERLSRPLPAAVLHGLTLWVWHAPGAFDAAVASYGLHAFEHACFFFTALLFWQAVLSARGGRRTAAALGAAFATLLHGGLLGALITLAPFPLYGWYHDRTWLWGWSPLEDQQLAGLIMWVPLGIVYFAACLLLAGRLLALQLDRSDTDPRLERSGQP